MTGILSMASIPRFCSCHPIPLDNWRYLTHNIEPWMAFLQAVNGEEKAANVPLRRPWQGSHPFLNSAHGQKKTFTWEIQQARPCATIHLSPLPRLSITHTSQEREPHNVVFVSMLPAHVFVSGVFFHVWVRQTAALFTLDAWRRRLVLVTWSQWR